MASSAIGEEVSRIGVADTTPVSPPTKPVEERNLNVLSGPRGQLTFGMEAVSSIDGATTRRRNRRTLTGGLYKLPGKDLSAFLEAVLVARLWRPQMCGYLLRWQYFPSQGKAK